MVIGVKTKRLLRLKAEAESKNPNWYLSELEEDFHGCVYPKQATEAAQQTPTKEKYAGNILLCKFPNWCLGRFLQIFFKKISVTKSKQLKSSKLTNPITKS